MKQFLNPWLFNGSILFSVLASQYTNAQVIPDNTLSENSVVTTQGNLIQITGGTRAGTNLFHSFEQFSIPLDTTASFNHAVDISSIFSRITGSSLSQIDGIIQTSGTANLFLINPNGIIFSENASLNVGGSFIATTADSIIFSDGIEYSTINTQTKPLLTINFPVGLRFNNNPQPITNFSFFDNGTNGEDLVGLRVPTDQTLALIGGDVSIEGGFLSTLGGRIEIGSVAGNNTVSLTQVEKGWDIGYEGVRNFQDINLTFAAFVESRGANTGDIEVQGRNIILIEGSEIAINTEAGQAGNLTIIASESLELSGNGAEVDLGDFETAIFSNIRDIASGQNSKLTIETGKLTLINGAQITAITFGTGKGVDININAAEIEIDRPFDELGVFKVGGIFALVLDDATGDGGDITINTEKLTASKGGQISTDTFGVGNSGDLLINASESIELIGTIPDSNIPSALFANVAEAVTATGNGGDLTINTQRLIVKDGAQIGTNANNQGNGGNLIINASESILLSNTSPLAEFRGDGRSGIFVNADIPIEDEAGNAIVTTGNAGTLNLTTGELIVEKGAIISADNFGRGKGGNATLNVNNLIVRNGGEIGAGSLLEVGFVDNQRGKGGALNINATESVEIFGTGKIGDETIKSTIFTLAEGTGDAGDLNIDTPTLTISNGADINVSATGRGEAGSANINAQDITLNNGRITAETRTGDQGNIVIRKGNSLVLRNNSQITTNATEEARGGNITITSDVIGLLENSDITANAVFGRGGDITITTQGIFQDFDSEITATSELGIDGIIAINNPDVDPAEGLNQLPANVIDGSRLIAKSCLAGDEENEFVVTGRGGLPANPYKSLRGDGLLSAEWVTLSEEVVSVQSRVDNAHPTGEIVEAQGWIIGENGNVRLTAAPTSKATGKLPWSIPHDCDG